MARDSFSLGHFPLVCGIIGFAVAVEEIVHHPAPRPSGEVVAALGVGIWLFVGLSALLYWRAPATCWSARLVILAVDPGRARAGVVAASRSGCSSPWRSASS